MGMEQERGYSETLDFCTAVQPALQARELVKAIDTDGVPQPEQTERRLGSGSDDFPSMLGGNSKSFTHIKRCPYE